MEFQKGQKSKLQDLGVGSKLVADCNIKSGATIDVSCFGVDENNKLSDERYMIFYNQKNSPNAEISMAINGQDNKFDLNLDALPTQIAKLVFTAAIDGNGSMKQLNELNFSFSGHSFKLDSSSFDQEKAIIVAEIYKKDGVWRFGAVGQGFSGGLAALLAYFGGTAAEEQAPAAHVKAATPVDMKKKVFLEKRVSLEKNLEQTAPKLLDLSKKAAVSLEKKGLGEHRAKVALCLDISKSMDKIYGSGAIQKFAERILALACRLDDDGSIDIFLFGENGYQPAPLSVKDFSGYVDRMLKSNPLEYDTRYSAAIELVRKFYAKPYKYERGEPHASDIPVYVMFVTDGKPSDKMQTTKALKNASMEPIFWQFMGINNGRPDFSYLERLDDLEGRYVDNADFFEVDDINQMSDEQLYSKLMEEYPKWVETAKSKGLII